MKTITFATTQMNLINCVEYLSTIKGEHTLFLMADNPARQKQLRVLLQNPLYKDFFLRTQIGLKTKYRIINFFLTIFYLLCLRGHCLFCTYDKVITGNYRNFASRLVYRQQGRKNSRCELIACDDGMATIAIAKARIVEINNKKPYVFWINRLLWLVHRNNFDSFIPKSVLFYTSYSILVSKHDSLMHNDYKYLKSHLDLFNIDKAVFDCQVILLGQPLYCKNFVTTECYVQKLLKYSETVKGKIVYYAHPEEMEEKWELLNVGNHYSFVNNYLPFEIIASILPDGCRVASFFSSVLVNLRLMNDTLIPECITFNQDELIDNSTYPSLKEAYDCYQKENIVLYEFD